MNSKKLLSGLRLSSLFLHHWKEVILFSSVFIFTLLFVLWFVGQERTIYYWDYANYFNLFKDFGRRLSQSRTSSISWLISSIRHDEYNYLPTLFLMPFYYLFGDGRLSFILSVAITYAFPCVLLFHLLIRKIFNLTSITDQPNVQYLEQKSKTEDFGLKLIPVIFLILFPAFWTPIMLGYVDVGGVGIIFLILFLYFRKTLIKQSVFELILLGLLLSFLILFRRWYSFWVVGFFIASTACVFIFFDWRQRKIKDLLISIRNIGTIGLTAVASFFIIATPIAIQMLVTDYGDLYSGFRQSVSPFIFYINIGAPLIVICFLGMVTAIFDRNLRFYSVFLLILFVCTYLLFTRTQDIHLHQMYWVISILIIFGSIIICKIYLWFQKPSTKLFCVLAFAIFCVSNFAVVFIPQAEHFLGSIKPGHPQIQASFAITDLVFPPIRIFPQVRTDLEKIQELMTTLDNLTKGTDKQIYVLSGSVTLNTDILRNACQYFKPEYVELNKKILHDSHMDSRDGFPFQMLKADYLVVTIPTDYLYFPDSQRVVGFLSDQIYYQKNIGKAYEPLNQTFVLEDNRIVYIYEKKRKFTENELKEISDIFVGFYPNQRERFEIGNNLIKELSGSK